MLTLLNSYCLLDTGAWHVRCKEAAAVSGHNIESPFLSHFFTTLQSLPFWVTAKRCLLRPPLPPDWSSHTLKVEKKIWGRCWSSLQRVKVNLLHSLRLHQVHASNEKLTVGGNWKTESEYGNRGDITDKLHGRGTRLHIRVILKWALCVSACTLDSLSLAPPHPHRAPTFPFSRPELSLFLVPRGGLQLSVLMVLRMFWHQGI